MVSIAREILKESRLSWEEAREQGFLFHGMGSRSFEELKKSKGFECGGFSDRPIKDYGPKFIAIKQSDLPKPAWSQGKWNVQYVFKEPFRDFVPIRSEEDVRYWGSQLYACPLKYVYEADSEGNILGPLV